MMTFYFEVVGLNKMKDEKSYYLVINRANQRSVGLLEELPSPESRNESYDYKRIDTTEAKKQSEILRRFGIKISDNI